MSSPTWRTGMPNDSRRDFNLIMLEPISPMSSMIFKKACCALHSDCRLDAKNNSKGEYASTVAIPKSAHTALFNLLRLE